MIHVVFTMRAQAQHASEVPCSTSEVPCSRLCLLGGGLHHTVSRAQGIVGAWQGRVAQRSHLQLRLKSPMTFSDIGTPHGSHIIHNCGPTARTISTYIHNVSIQNVVDPQIMPFEKLNNIEESVVSSCKLGLLENTGGRVYRVQRKEILK